jgi:glycosyltransferase involved in cell wall biosynthesis
MPVYNGGRHLRAAVESLLAQTHRDFELIISDNASTDETAAIALELAERDSRIRYHRNETNIGMPANFRRVVELARGEYFMWAAHDDRWAPEFLAENLARVQGREDVIGSCSRVEWVDVKPGLWTKYWARHGTAALLGSVRQNLVRFLWNPGTCSRIYGVFRRKILPECTAQPLFWAADTMFIVSTLKYGKYDEVERPLLFRRRGASRDMVGFVLSHNPTRLGKVLPFWDATRAILAQPHVPHSPAVLVCLAKLNAVHAVYFFAAVARAWGTWLATIAGIRTRQG